MPAWGVFTQFMRELWKPWASFYTLYAQIMQALSEFLHTLCANYASHGGVFTNFMRRLCKPWATFYTLYVRIMQALSEFLHTLCANYASHGRVFTHFMRELCKPWGSFYTLYAWIMQALGEFLHTLCANSASLGRVFIRSRRSLSRPAGPRSAPAGRPVCPARMLAPDQKWSKSVSWVRVSRAEGYLPPASPEIFLQFPRFHQRFHQDGHKWRKQGAHLNEGMVWTTKDRNLAGKSSVTWGP